MRATSSRPETSTEATALFQSRPASEPKRAPPPPQNFDFDTVRGGPTVESTVTNLGLAKDDLDEETRQLDRRATAQSMAAVDLQLKTDPIGLEAEEATQADRSLLDDTDLLAELAADARPDETLEQRIRRRIMTLLDRGFVASAVGEHERAAAALELALSEPDLPQSRQIIEQHRDAITRALEVFIGNLDRRPRLASALAPTGLSKVAVQLLARVDGRRSFRELVAGSGVATLAAYRALAELIRGGAFEPGP